MNVVVLVKIGVDAQNRRAASYIGQRRMAGFLHNVAEVAGKLKFPGTRNDRRLNVKHLTAGSRPRKTSDKSDLIVSAKLFGLKLG